MLIPVIVESVRMNVANNSRVVILKDEKLDRYLLVWVGQSESTAIALQLQGEKAPRPLTADLLKTVVDELGAKVTAVHITDLIDGIFHAHLLLTNAAGEPLEIDARPSDCIAIAVRTDAPVFVEEELLDKESIKLPAEQDDRLDVYRDFVNSLFEGGLEPGEGERRPDA